MKILFYVEPLIEQDKPYWKDGWVGVFCRDIINTLNHSENSYEFLIMTNEAIAQKVEIETPIIQLTQKELLEPFHTTNYMDVTTAWHHERYTSEQLEDYKSLMLEKLNGFTPDIIITFSPVPFFREMLPNTLILHHEYSIFSRLPYPQSWFLDPVGMHNNLFLDRFQDEIKAIELSEKQTGLLNAFKELCQNILTSKSPFKKIFEEKRKQFDYLVLLPLQFSRYYSFDDLVPFKSQYEYCVYILDNVPSNIGVVVNTHPEYPVISKEAVEFLKTKYPHFIYEDEFNSIYASGQFILPFVDAVITVSSSVGLQTLFFDKKLITLSDNTFSFMADDTSIDNIEKVLEAENIDKNSFLYFILTRHSITQEYLHNPQWLDNFLVNSLKRFRNNGVTFDFYNCIDTDENIFNSLNITLNSNENLIPQWLSKNFTQLFIDQGNGISEESSIRLPVVGNDEVQTFTFDISKYENIANLRLDPLNDSCVIEIERLVLVKVDGSEVDLTPKISANVCSHHGKAYFFEHFDPQIYFEGLSAEELKGSESLEMVVRYAHIAKDAVHVCANQIANDKNHLVNMLEQTKKELDQTKSSLSWRITQPLRKIKQTLKGK